MPTNQSMLRLLEQQAELVDRLTALNEKIREHIKAQKRQHGKNFKDRYIYLKSKKMYKRVWRK